MDNTAGPFRSTSGVWRTKPAMNPGLNINASIFVIPSTSFAAGSHILQEKDNQYIGYIKMKKPNLNLSCHQAQQKTESHQANFEHFKLWSDS